MHNHNSRTVILFIGYMMGIVTITLSIMAILQTVAETRRSVGELALIEGCRPDKYIRDTEWEVEKCIQGGGRPDIYGTSGGVNCEKN